MEFKRITTEREAAPKLRHLPKVVALDLEFECQKTPRGDLDTSTAKLISIVIGNADIAYSFPVELLDVVWKALERCRLIFTQFFSTDARVLKKYGKDLLTLPFIDDCLLDHLIDENVEHNLGSMVLRRYGDNYKEEFWSKYKNIEDAPEDERLEYESKDAIYQYRLGRDYMDELRGKEALIEHVHNLARALYETEVRGVKVDVELIRQTKKTMSTEIEQYIPKLEREFRDHCALWELEKWNDEISKRKTEKGRLQVSRPKFSFASSTQIQWLVYDALQCPVMGKTKKGSPSTDYETLETLSKDHPELKTLVEYKGAKTLYSTFVEGMLDRVIDSRIYPRFNVNGTTTGRISHSNPNLGNIPKDGPIRGFFIPDDGRVLIGADFSQLEVIVEANLTKDPNLIRIINEGVSKHDITAEGLRISREAAKTLNFALQYGAGVHKVSKLLNCSYSAAQDTFDRYWKLYSGVKILKDQTSANLERDNSVTNLFGRTRHFPKPQNDFEKGKQERQAYNFLIQGVGADLCNRAFYEYYDNLRSTGRGESLWSVHDEILAQVKPEYAEEEKQTLVKTMTDLTEFIGFEFPLQAVAYGPLKVWAKT